jgi:hypothetical protein
VDADRAAMDYAAHAGIGRHRHQATDRRCIHCSIRVGIDTRLTVNRRDVVNDVHPLTGPRNSRVIAEVANREVDADALEITTVPGLADQCPDFMSTRPQASSEMTAGESARAGHEVTHVRRGP